MQLSKKVTLLVLLSVAVCIESAAIAENKTYLLNTEPKFDAPKHKSANQWNNPSSSSPVVPQSLVNLQRRPSSEQSKRVKRAIIFRPLFVYRQQQIKKQRLREMREQRKQQQIATQQSSATQTPKYAFRYPYYYSYTG